MDAQLQYAYDSKTINPDPSLPDVTIPEKYINIFRDLAWSNAKNFEVSDKEGHVLGALVDIHVQSEQSGRIAVVGAANSWKLRNAFRKFHAYREHMFREAGITKSERGPYGRTLRPYLDPAMADGSKVGAYVLDPLWTKPFQGATGSSPIDTTNPYSMALAPPRGEWIYTRFATVGSALAGATSQSDSDDWTIHILNENITAGVGIWESVGMIHSYNQDRMEVMTPEAAATITPMNPLAALQDSGNTAVGEIVTIADELEMEEPPYDRDDNGDSVQRQLLGMGQILSSTTTGMTTLRNVFVPAGLFVFAFTEFGTSAGTTKCDILIDVNAVIKCKDVA